MKQDLKGDQNLKVIERETLYTNMIYCEVTHSMYLIVATQISHLLQRLTQSSLTFINKTLKLTLTVLEAKKVS